MKCLQVYLTTVLKRDEFALPVELWLHGSCGRPAIRSLEVQLIEQTFRREVSEGLLRRYENPTRNKQELH